MLQIGGERPSGSSGTSRRITDGSGQAAGNDGEVQLQIPSAVLTLAQLGTALAAPESMTSAPDEEKAGAGRGGKTDPLGEDEEHE